MKYKRCLLRCGGTRVHTSFYSMKGQRAFLLSPGWYAGSLQDKHTHTPPPLPHLFRLWYTTYLFSGVKGEDYCGSMVSCPGTQHDKPLRAWKLPESHRLTKTQQFSLVCVCSQVSVSIHSLCRCSDTYSYINGEKMVNFLVCESVFFFFCNSWTTSTSDQLLLHSIQADQSPRDKRLHSCYQGTTSLQHATMVLCWFHYQPMSTERFIEV